MAKLLSEFSEELDSSSLETSSELIKNIKDLLEEIDKLRLSTEALISKYPIGIHRLNGITSEMDSKMRKSVLNYYSEFVGPYLHRILSNTKKPRLTSEGLVMEEIRSNILAAFRNMAKVNENTESVILDVEGDLIKANRELLRKFANSNLDEKGIKELKEKLVFPEHLDFSPMQGNISENLKGSDLVKHLLEKLLSYVDSKNDFTEEEKENILKQFIVIIDFNLSHFLQGFLKQHIFILQNYEGYDLDEEREFIESEFADDLETKNEEYENIRQDLLALVNEYITAIYETMENLKTALAVKRILEG